ncbi:uncharacterized protein L969DRAFT_97067 [Mixia osmundae IAM 14324]|uniref:Inositol polyphosphate-related phosphatase domain-containing protein n=1 Tax=Mixia osmundae (strain CBS 9802 / IAM 14324 / JCM 22182 / KY 12970) TaxID=764103 RepID=G7E1K5_MIXOS|nr:uncharacterized protein L969DRAFT_97067 [Mixia osmundae IAM 14324]KEI36667.1 hypothetical protein L969DRAFT_97067 [Mixia osmundae IAM 14324]GAA96715.1 hypothetical protein E5Q_03386 [Mixia osmundae IAM 14324]
MPRTRVSCHTFNANLGKGKGKTDYDKWLVPTRSDDSREYADEEPPDIYAIGFQEVLPLHWALVGLSGSVLDKHDVGIKQAIESYNEITNLPDNKPGREDYTLMAKHIMGTIALLVYTRDETITNKVRDVRVSSAGTGYVYMANKGGVAVRLTVDEADEGERKSGEAVYTFVNCHLAAHDHKIKQRNDDWKNVISRCVFTPGQPSRHFTPPRPRSPFSGSQPLQIYDSSYLFVMGDLNYRLSQTTPRPLSIKQIGSQIHFELPKLFEHDQLNQEKEAGRTMHHLLEGEIDFKPSYKYKVNTADTYKDFSKRIPGWCDRVLYATWADDGAGDGTVRKKKGATKTKEARIDLYRSIMAFTNSDHKPVVSIISLPRHPHRPHEPLRLAHSPPFGVDGSWRIKQIIGTLFDRIVGLLWCGVVFIGFGKDRVGLVNIIILGYLHYRYGLDPRTWSK